MAFIPNQRDARFSVYLALLALATMFCAVSGCASGKSSSASPRPTSQVDNLQSEPD